MNWFFAKTAITDDTVLVWQGIETGKTTVMDVDDERGLIALKIAGHVYWSSIMTPRAYAPAKFVVCNMQRTNDGFKIDIITPVMEWPVRGGK